MSYPCFRGHKAEVYKLGIDVLMCDEVCQTWLAVPPTHSLILHAPAMTSPVPCHVWRLSVCCRSPDAADA